jgi:hypothetical protein
MNRETNVDDPFAFFGVEPTRRAFQIERRKLFTIGYIQEFEGRAFLGKADVRNRAIGHLKVLETR